MLPLCPAEPAMVLTACDEVILRKVWFKVSAIKTLPSLSMATPTFSTATPEGLSKRAALPMPSVLPELAARPAMVVTCPVEATILRIVLLSVSET